jgi:predicted phage baseplate assembly protein
VAGNVGANTLAHIISGEAIKEGGVTNPLPAQGGMEPETMEHVRQNAPSAFRKQERAVTPLDYEEIAIREDVAERCDVDVQRAAATLRWTGSWHTMFVTVDRHGGRRVDEDFEEKLRRCLERFRMAGQDLEVDAPHPVSLEIEIAVCVKPGYFFSDVQQTLFEVFSNRTLRDGRRGLFHPDNFSFGQPVYLSSIFAAAQAVTGVDSLMVTKFQRQGRASEEALDSGKLELGRLEIARLDNDPNFPEHGVFHLIHG